MKKNYLKRGGILLGAILMLNCFTACNREAVQEENSIEATATNVEDGEATDDLAMDTGSDCDQFLTDYEEYIDEYVEVAKRMQEDPSDATILSEYTSLAAKAGTWTANAADCESDPEFTAKYLKLSTSMAQKKSAK